MVWQDPRDGIVAETGAQWHVIITALSTINVCFFLVFCRTTKVSKSQLNKIVRRSSFSIII